MEQKANEFVNQYNNKHIDEDGYYGAQCWDVVARYAREKFGCPSFPTVTGGAAGLFTNTHPTISKYFDRVANNPNDANQIPPNGAIIVWGTAWSPPYGHTAIKIAGGKGQNMTVFEQNGNNPGGNAYTKVRNYAGVIGWLVPKQGVDDMSKIDVGIARVLSWGILGRNGIDGTPNALNAEADGDLNANHVGAETNGRIWEFYNSNEGQNWIHNRLPSLVDRAAKTDAIGKQLSDANTALQGLQTQVIELGKRPTQAKLDELTKSITEANDKAVKAQAELEKIKGDQAKDQETGNAFLRWLGKILNGGK